MKKKKDSIEPTTAENLEEKFDNGEDVLDYFDTDVQRMNLDLPIWALKELDQEATRRGIARQALIKTWLIDRIDLLKATQKK